MVLHTHSICRRLATPGLFRNVTPPPIRLLLTRRYCCGQMSDARDGVEALATALQVEAPVVCPMILPSHARGAGRLAALVRLDDHNALESGLKAAISAADACGACQAPVGANKRKRRKLSAIPRWELDLASSGTFDFDVG